ncbi:MAG: hypothetical protein MI741_16200, partial [Rhodospirillales bacterium]|nr:hypothetical protein [Rhodospirillales bacterium]
MSEARTILLVAAISVEIEPTLRRLGIRAWQPPAQPKLQPRGDERAACRVGAAVTGVGAERVASAMSRAFDDARPDEVILLGLSGGLCDRVEPGVAYHIPRVRNEAGESRELATSPLDLPVISLVSVDEVVTQASAKRELHERTQRDAVDMETFGAAGFCGGRDVPLTVYRAIGDTADELLPAAVASWVRDDGSIDTARASSYAMSRPFQLPK